MFVLCGRELNLNYLCFEWSKTGGGVISSILFSLYIDPFFNVLSKSGDGCHIRYVFFRENYVSTMLL